MSAAAASAARLVHPLPDFINNSVDGGVREGTVPPHGTRSEVAAHRAGAPGTRPLSTGGPREAAGMISFSFVRSGR
ncbi:hypothetical protein SSCG_01796 [Streptomyces clavuligerus]|nr:hypothetical protein SSCG_01796 [Streptomyces clavuligerus]